MDDLNDEQFIDSLSLTNRIIYIRRKTTNLLRAWIIVQERILKFDNVRAAVQNGGYEPWETSHPAYRFRKFNHYGLGAIPVSTLKYDVIGLIPDMTKKYKCVKRKYNLS